MTWLGYRKCPLEKIHSAVSDIKIFWGFLHFQLLKGSCEAQFSNQGQNFVSNSRSDFWRKNILCDLKLMLHIINPQDTLLDLKIEEGKMSPLYTA